MELDDLELGHLFDHRRAWRVILSEIFLQIPVLSAGGELNAHHCADGAEEVVRYHVGCKTRRWRLSFRPG